MRYVIRNTRYEIRDTKNGKRLTGFSLIELLIVVAIVAILILLVMWAFYLQAMKGRDAKRKADLTKVQKILEDYYNDNDCYPDTLACNNALLPYLSSVPCDPINDGQNHIYFYSVSSQATCKRWYKIFTTLEYQKDPIIKKIGCTFATCGNFNYVVASANVETLVQQPGEVPPTGGGGASPTPTQAGPTATSPPTPTQGPTPTSTPTPCDCRIVRVQCSSPLCRFPVDMWIQQTCNPPGCDSETKCIFPRPPCATPTPTPCLGGWFTCVNQGGKCNVSYEGAPGAVCSSTCNFCTTQDCSILPICLF